MRHALSCLLIVLAASATARARTSTSPTVRATRGEVTMVRVPAGPFWMGLSADGLAEVRRDCEQAFGPDLADYECGQRDGQLNPRFADAYTGSSMRRVVLPTYYIDRHEVTFAAYRACVHAGACDPRPLVAGDRRYVVDAWPVVGVTWTEARAFCRHQGKRLPTEAEWEKAARGADGRPWPWGTRYRVGLANVGQVEPEELRYPHPFSPAGFDVDDADGAKIMRPPGSFPWGASPYGVQDMAGNVAEWVADAYDPSGYAGLPLVAPSRTDAETAAYRVVRGGSYEQPSFIARTYYRYKGPPENRSHTRGFRCARDPRAASGR